MGVEGLEQDVLDREGELLADIELAAALGLADMDPVDGAVAGALLARGFAEGLQQDGPNAVALPPVGGQPARGSVRTRSVKAPLGRGRTEASMLRAGWTAIGRLDQCQQRYGNSSKYCGD